MIDAYEQKYGPVEDRSLFSGDIVVPPHLRNISLVNTRSNRLHGGLFGSLSRSRTFLSLSTDVRSSFCGSVPDLSRNSIDSSYSRGSSFSYNASGSPPPLPSPSAILGGFSHPGSPTSTNRNTMPPIRQLLTRADDIELRAKLHGNGRSVQMYGDNADVPRQNLSPPDPKGYMALIRTNHTNSLPNRHSSSIVSARASHFAGDSELSVVPSSPQSMPFNQHNQTFSMSYGHELSLDNIAKYTIPRVSLRNNSLTSPLVSPHNQRKFSGHSIDAHAFKKDTNHQYEEDSSAA